ncbi:Rv3235 family protein [Georgenia thermotolerans]|uniref:Energy transducer TonB n=1 Tax=Georgenia thermotolerans TaxID=527326 RepID=A0A7J5UNF6_9MICO|nr:Rv3235 family protein [Georgenia thermotolerans]KAE8763936.1 energy transducer TonB [Georgenia thermotolerans]
MSALTLAPSPARSSATIAAPVHRGDEFDLPGSAGGAPGAPPRAPARPGTRPTWDRVRFVGGIAPAPPSTKRATARGAVVLTLPELPREDTPQPLPEPAPWAGAVVLGAVEALIGLRPPNQLARLLAPELYGPLARRARLAERVVGRPARARRTQVRRVRVCRIDPRTVEAAVVVHDGDRVRGAAVRLEAHRGRWRATALEIG